jgi:hypothetical protein
VVEIGLVLVLYAEVVDDEGEGDVACLVAE